MHVHPTQFDLPHHCSLAHMARISSVCQSLNPWWVVLYITKGRSIQSRIDTVPKGRHLTMLLRTVHKCQTVIKNGPIAELTSVLMDLVSFKVKISAALHHVSKAE